MPWIVEYDPEAVQDFKKIDRAMQRKILDYMDKRIALAANPPISGSL